MRIRLPELAIDDADPYKGDVLGRKPFGDALTNLVRNSEGAFTLSIDGQWGDGKTSFSRMWRAQLVKEGVRALYFDAFANDYGEDPFVPLSAALLDAINPKSIVKSKALKAKVAAIGVKLLKIGGRAALRAATAGFFDGGDIERIADDVAKDASDAVTEAIEQKLAAYTVSEREINEFRSLLSEVAWSDETGLPAVVILDELDRCRPTYAVAMLEKVKHFFSVDGVVFAFVMNSKQMCACIEHLYGAGIDARQYLHKFIDVECALPPKTLSTGAPSGYSKYAQHLLNGYGLNSGAIHLHDIYEYVVDLSAAFGLSLRDMEKVCRSIALFYASIDPNRQLHLSPLVVLLAVLKIVARDSYERLASGTKDDFTSIVTALSGTKTSKYVKAWFLACLGTDSTLAAAERIDEGQINNLVRGVRLNPSQFIPYHCAKLDYFD